MTFVYSVNYILQMR